MPFSMLIVEYISSKLSRSGQELTKAINKKNEEAAAGKAEQTGGKLGIVKAPPTVSKESKSGPKGTKHNAEHGIEVA